MTVSTRMQNIRHGTAGFAIPIAIFVIVVLSLLALTGLYVAQSNAAANTAVRRSWKAFYAANAGATRSMAIWDRATFAALSPGDSAVTVWQTLPDGSQFRTTVLRVDDGVVGGTPLYRMRTIGRPGSGHTAQRILVTLVRLVRAEGLCCDGAVKVRGRLRLQGSASRVKVSGLDENPSGWGGMCPTSPGDLPGILLEDDDDLTVNGNPTLEGDPPVLEDGGIDDSDFTQFGDLSYDDLAALADKSFDGDQNFSSIQPAVSGGSCSTDVPTNWGDPLDSSAPCWNYLPIVHVGGDLHLSGGAYGQGILLVDGDLTVSGTLEYYGVVIVQGEADLRGTTDLHGALLVRNGLRAGSQSNIRGNSQIQYSSCAALRAASQAAAARPLAGRHWFEVLE